MSESKLVLIVEDSPSVRETIAFILEAEGYEVRTAPNGEAGLALVDELNPRVVLTDAMMPEMDGFELCSRIRRNPEHAAICVIMLTSMGQTIDRERADEAGVDHFATKPFDEDQILTLLRNELGG